MNTPLQDRSNHTLRSLLSELRHADSNGWCIATDGSLDHQTDAEAIATITESLEYIAEVNR